MRLKLFLLLLLTATIPSLAQKTGITGKVVNTDTGAPVAGATVILETQGLSVDTDPTGSFSITNATPGTDALVIVAYGYNDYNAVVDLASGIVENLGIIKLTDSDLMTTY